MTDPGELDPPSVEHAYAESALTWTERDGTVLGLPMPVGPAPPRLDWIYASAAHLIESGERTGVFRIAATSC